MRVLLRDLAPGQEYAIQFRASNGDQASRWSQVNRFTTTNDLIAPAQVVNITWYNSGPAFIAEWDRVELNSDGSELKDFRHYRCVVSDGTTDAEFFVLRERFELSREMNAAAFGDFKSSLSITVHAVDNTYNESVGTTISVDPEAPPVAAPPVLGNHYGSVLLEWSGLDVEGATMPINVDYVEVHVGDNPDFIPTGDTLNSTIDLNRSSQLQRAILVGLENGETYYAKLIVVDVLRKKSQPSLPSNAVTKQNLTGLEIEDGQIGPMQINFTARDIGGANAYFPADDVARDAITTAVEGDVAYLVGPGWGYATYRFNGVSWDEAPEIGVISGTKILAGTVTADAVGTNLIISAKANIGEAIIDTSHIDELNANVITAGVLQSSFLVNYDGTNAVPAWSLDLNGNAIFNNAEIKGQVVVGSSNLNQTQNATYALRSYNYIAGISGWTINGDGSVEFSKATIRGVYKTAETGRRIEMGSAGDTGRIDFFSTTEYHGFFRSYTQPGGTIEAIQFGMQVPGYNSTLWNRINYNASANGEYATYRSGTHEFTFDSTVPNVGGSFMVWNGVNRDTGTGYLRFNIGNGGTAFTNPVNTSYTFNWKDLTPRIEVVSGDNFHSPRIRLFNSITGGMFKFYTAGGGDPSRTESRWWDDSGFVHHYAASFVAGSDASTKLSITQVDRPSLLRDLRRVPVKKYRRKKGPGLPDKDGNPTPLEGGEYPEEIGLIAQEAPAQIIASPASDGTLGIDLYQMASMTWGAVQELADQVETLRAQVIELGKKK